jgi:hypothetical protein
MLFDDREERPVSNSRMQILLVCLIVSLSASASLSKIGGDLRALTKQIHDVKLEDVVQLLRRVFEPLKATARQPILMESVTGDAAISSSL